jgi:hypothetical protein
VEAAHRTTSPIETLGSRLAKTIRKQQIQLKPDDDHFGKTQLNIIMTFQHLMKLFFTPAPASDCAALFLAHPASGYEIDCMEATMHRALATIVVIAFALTAFSANAKQCRDQATGKFMKCSQTETHCRNPTTGKFEKCPG